MQYENQNTLMIWDKPYCHRAQFNMKKCNQNGSTNAFFYFNKALNNSKYKQELKKSI